MASLERRLDFTKEHQYQINLINNRLWAQGYDGPANLTTYLNLNIINTRVAPSRGSSLVDNLISVDNLLSIFNLRLGGQPDCERRAKACEASERVASVRAGHSTVGARLRSVPCPSAFKVSTTTPLRLLAVS